MAETQTETDAEFEQALVAWIHDVLGVEGFRRAVRVTDEQVLVSKFPPGFAARLHELLDQLPQIFQEEAVVAAYERAAHDLPADTPRVDAWHAAMHGMLRELGERLDVPDDRLVEVRVGIDSVRAVLEAVLWSAPSVTDDYTPRSGEVEAYRDGLAALADDRDIFTRYYGDFRDRAVLNHCPGAQFARRMLAQGWTACTATPPPV